jgi:hypothetical protein
MASPQGGPTMAYPPVQPAPTSWWRRLPTAGKVAVIVVPVLALCCGGTGIIGALNDPSKPAAASGPQTTSAAAASSAPVGDMAGPLAAPSSSAETTSPATVIPTPSLSAKPTVQTRTVTETRSLRFKTKRVNDSHRAAGSTAVTTHGVNGVTTLTYRVTITNGVQTAKKLVSQHTTKEPVTKIIAVGTKKTQKCDPNYSGACVPIASDVDCAGGGGNGPAYVQGPVKVIGSDIYDLDRDGDGIGCD